MNKEKKDFINLLQDLCEMYEHYISLNEGSKLRVIISNNSINMNLYKHDIVDTFELTFDDREKDICIYLGVLIMKFLFKKSIMFNEDNLFYNMDKPYLEIVVDDDLILDKIFNVLVLGKEINLYNSVNAVNKKTNIKRLEERINLSRKVLRLDDK